MTRSKAAQLRQRASRRAALLGAYVAPEVVAHIVSDGRTPLLSGVRLPVTVLFADIRGFTRLADMLPAERVVTMLDEFFDAMSAPALAHRAMIDKLIGDAIMLVYGVPSAEGDEQWRAMSTASSMHSAFAVLRARWKPTLPPSLLPGFAIGCASGEAVLANVGSAARMDYTLVGRPVNLAARLTAVAGDGETLVSVTVRDAVLAAHQTHVLFGRARHLVLKGMRGRAIAYPTSILVKRPTARTAPATATDPVCGMKVGAQRGLVLVYSDHEYYFCSPACRTSFRRSPRRYV